MKPDHIAAHCNPSSFTGITSYSIDIAAEAPRFLAKPAKLRALDSLLQVDPALGDEDDVGGVLTSMLEHVDTSVLRDWTRKHWRRSISSWLAVLSKIPEGHVLAISRFSM